MAKRRAVDVTVEKPNFPGAQDNPFGGGFVFRDNSEQLQKLGKQALILRPTQMGKSCLFALANMLYNRRFKDRGRLEVRFRPHDANARFVLSVTFLNVTGMNVADVDRRVHTTVCKAVSKFIKQNPELQELYQEPTDGRPGDYLEAAAEAVARLGERLDEDQSFLVLVDEYDKPARDLLLDLIGTGATASWESAKTNLLNYRSFFTGCKAITENTFLEDTDGLGQVNVWVAGVLPLALKLISDFNPKNYTFETEFAEAIGMLDHDVDSMLQAVDAYLPFGDGLMEEFRAAIGKLANRLYFVSGTPLYHTRVVNSIMQNLLNSESREMWLKNLSQLPVGTHFEVVSRSVFDVVRQQNQVEIRQAIKALSLNREIPSTLNEDLNLGDVLRSPMSLPDYLTLLVHLGIASVRLREGQTVFQATSTYFRIPFFKRLLENSLQPLLDASSLEEIYAIGEKQVAEFMEVLPRSGMASMIHWAELKRENNILELQFQGFLIGELAELLWHEEVATTQEDRLETGRTDVTIEGKSNFIILELKQKPERTGPTNSEMKKHHAQLHRYMKELVQRESAKLKPKLVAGFVVVMYNNRQSFHVERTTYRG